VLHLLLALTSALLAPFPTTTTVIGQSAAGRPIVAIDRGDRASPPVLVVGCIHADECAGMEVVRRLKRMPLPPLTHLLLVPALNPDGRVIGTRLNGRGVDLNRNFPTGWLPDGARWSTQYAGPRPFSEPESRIAARLVRRADPAVTVWYHQHMDLVWAWGPSRAAGAEYARVSGMRFAPMHWLPGTAPHWQNVALHRRSFVVELPAGRMSDAQIRRHAAAVLQLAQPPS
jgi:hypothetical protein